MIWISTFDYHYSREVCIPHFAFTIAHYLSIAKKILSKFQNNCIFLLWFLFAYLMSKVRRYSYYLCTLQIQLLCSNFIVFILISAPIFISKFTKSLLEKVFINIRNIIYVYQSNYKLLKLHGWERNEIWEKIVPRPFYWLVDDHLRITPLPAVTRVCPNTKSRNRSN